MLDLGLKKKERKPSKQSTFQWGYDWGTSVWSKVEFEAQQFSPKTDCRLLSRNHT